MSGRWDPPVYVGRRCFCGHWSKHTTEVWAEMDGELVVGNFPTCSVHRFTSSWPRAVLEVAAMLRGGGPRWRPVGGTGPEVMH